MYTLYWTVHNIMLAVECLVFVSFTVYYKWLDKAGKYIYYYIIASTVFAAGALATAMAEISSVRFFSVMMYIQFWILSLFQCQINKKLYIRRLIRVLLIPVTIISYLDFFWWKGPYSHYSIAESTGIVLLIIYESIFILQLLFDRVLVLQMIFVHSLPNFWFNAGLFLLHTSALFYLLPYNYILQNFTPENYEMFNNFYMLMGAFVFLMGTVQMIFFYIGLRKLKKLNN